jgi:hypothetical protein
MQKLRTIKMRSEQSWSLLDPKPVLLYLSNSDEYIVYWNGITMTHTMALCMAMEHFGIWATPEMKTHMEQDYERIYYANGFQTRAWDGKVSTSPVYPYLKRIMLEHVKKVIEGREAKEVLGWFDYSKARKEEHV